MHSEPKADAKSVTPLYDDFLDIMNDASSKALKESRAIPAYDDFLHLMKESAEKASREQAELPSYDDFVAALKETGVDAKKTPVPTYTDFLRDLQRGAERAMHQRHQREMKDSSIETLKWNPLDDMAYGSKGEKEESELQAELRRLQEERKKKQEEHGGNVPHHEEKPIMERINVLRTQLCWQRPNLWEHEKCLRFLGINCMKASTGEGICKAFTKEAKNKCENSDNADFKEDYCALAEALDDNYEEEEEMEDPESEEEEIEEEEDKELDKELVGGGAPEGAEAVTENSEEKVVEEELEQAPKGEELAPGGDKDGDGVLDAEDAFPDDPNEWKDTDGDGIGDNADDDLDGDGHKNDVDKFPADPKEWADSDGDGIGDNADKDRDNDGIEDDKDKFPDDPTEWLDSDGDGVGDNKDAYPLNPKCHSHTKPCLEVSAAPGPAPAGAVMDPATLDMDSQRGLPDQGYNEHMTGPLVRHANYYTYTSDWQDEFPAMEDSEKSTLSRICQEHPDNSWCLKLRAQRAQDSHFR